MSNQQNNRGAVGGRFGAFQPTGSIYSSDKVPLPQPGYTSEEQSWMGSLEQEARSLTQNADVFGNNDGGNNQSFLPLPCHGLAGTGPEPEEYEPFPGAVDGDYPPNPGYTEVPPPLPRDEPSMSKRPQQQQRRSQAGRSERSGAPRQQNAQPPVQPPVTQETLQLMVAREFAKQQQMAFRQQQHTSAPMPAQLPPPRAGNGVEQVAPYRHVEMTEKGATKTFNLHIDFDSFSAEDMAKIEGKKTSEKMSFEVSPDIFRKFFPATYDPSTDKYMRPNLERAVIQKVEIMETHNDFPKSLLFQCEQLADPDLSNMHIADGRSGFVVMRAETRSEAPKTVYDATGRFENTSKIAKYGQRGPEEITTGVSFPPATRLPNGAMAEPVALVPWDHMVGQVIRANAERQPKLKDYVDAALKSPTGFITVPVKAYNTVASALEDTIVKEMGATSLSKLTFTVSPSNNKVPVTDFTGTKHASDPNIKKKKFSVNADVRITAYIPFTLKGKDKPMIYEEIPAAMRG